MTDQGNPMVQRRPSLIDAAMQEFNTSNYQRMMAMAGRLVLEFAIVCNYSGHCRYKYQNDN